MNQAQRRHHLSSQVQIYLPFGPWTFTSRGATPALLVSTVKDWGTLALTTPGVRPGPEHFTLDESTTSCTGTLNGLPTEKKETWVKELQLGGSFMPSVAYCERGIFVILIFTTSLLSFLLTSLAFKEAWEMWDLASDQPIWGLWTGSSHRVTIPATSDQHQDVTIAWTDALYSAQDTPLYQ